MKELNLLVWITQLALSVAMPLGGFTVLGWWISQRFDLGVWVILCGCAVGLIGAVNGFRNSLKIMAAIDRKNAKKDPPPISFNDHE